MRKVFADTYYFLALLNIKDKGHARAIEFTKTFDDQMVVTDWVMIELADALAGTPKGRAEFVSTLDDLRSDSMTRIIAADDSQLKAGIQLYSQRNDKQWSLTDCISFVVMQSQSIHEALTADHHFEQAGFVALLR